MTPATAAIVALGERRLRNRRIAVPAALILAALIVMAR